MTPSLLGCQPSKLGLSGARHWRSETPLPWKTHFALKETLNLPEAVATDSEVAYGAPVRPGDRIRCHEILRSVSEFKTTKRVFLVMRLFTSSTSRPKSSSSL